MTAEMIYKSCCDVVHGYAVAIDQDPAELLKLMEKDLTTWSHSTLFPALAPLAAIMQDSREKMDRATTSAGTLAALKRIAKAANRDNMRGGWTDAAGRFCVCSGFHAVRLHGVKFDSIPAIPGFDGLEKCMQRPASDLYEIEPPSVADCKAFKAQHGKGSQRPMPIDGGRRWVNPAYMVDMLQALPGAKVYTTDAPTSPIWFESDQGDGILMPARPPRK